MTKTIRNLVMALVVTAGAAGAMASPALAADWDRGRDGRVQEWRHDDWRAHYAPDPTPYAYGYVAPAYVAPAYGYYGPYGYAAPPVAAYAPPAASFSLTVPLR